jgi:hypothetical protein
MSLRMPKQFVVDFKWRTISTSSQQNWPFYPQKQVNKKAYKDLRLTVAGPHVYRFCFYATEGKPRCYVGESERFERRLSQYIGTLTNLRGKQRIRDLALPDLELADKELQNDSEVRVGAAIQNAEIDREHVELQVVDFDEFGFNKSLISQEGLSNPFVRRLIENLAILDADESGFNMLNNGRDVDAKWLSRRLYGKRPAKKHPSEAKAQQA